MVYGPMSTNDVVQCMQYCNVHIVVVGISFAPMRWLIQSASNLLVHLTPHRALINDF